MKGENKKILDKTVRHLKENFVKLVENKDNSNNCRKRMLKIEFVKLKYINWKWLSVQVPFSSCNKDHMNNKDIWMSKVVEESCEAKWMEGVD